MSIGFDRYAAEQATGIRQMPTLGMFFRDPDGASLTDEEAQDLLFDGKTFSVPNAGAGSYTEVFRRVGYSVIEPMETGATSGDWAFAVFDGERWYPAWQSNRYPHHGFSYSVGHDQGFKKLKQLIKCLFS